MNIQIVGKQGEGKTNIALILKCHLNICGKTVVIIEEGIKAPQDSSDLPVKSKYDVVIEILTENKK